MPVLRAAYMLAMHAPLPFVTRARSFAPSGRSRCSHDCRRTDRWSACVDCIFSDWMGAIPPLGLHLGSIGNVVDTVFRNMRLNVELVDVSDRGIVRMQNVSLANVTLTRGNVVTTGMNDYIQQKAFRVTYYAADDANYDIELTPVPVGERGMFGEEFVVEDDIMSDCLWLPRPRGAPMPGCPEASLAQRDAVVRRGRSAAEQAEVPEDVYPGYEGYEDYSVEARLDTGVLDASAPWLLAVRAALGPLPPPPPGWPPFAVTPPGEPVARTLITMPLPVPAAAMVPGFERTAAAVQQAQGSVAAIQASYTGTDGSDSGDSGAIAVAAVVALLAAVAAAAALYAAWHLRREKRAAAARREGLLSQRRPRLPHWMSGGMGTATVRLSPL